MEISDEVYINSMNDISKHFQIMLDNKDKKIADLQSQLDQQKAMWKMLKYFIINRPYCAGYVILESGMRVITDILATMRKLEKGEDDE